MLGSTFELRDMHCLQISFETTPFLSLPVKNSGQFNFLQNLHLYTQKSVCATNTIPFVEVGGKSPLHLSSRTHFAKIIRHILLQLKIKSYWKK